MLEIKFIRENKDIVAAAIKNRSRTMDLDALFSIHDKKKDFLQRLEEINKQRNIAAQERDIARGTELKKEAEAMEEERLRIDKEFMALMIKVPNIISPDTPVGADDKENKVIRQCGEKPVFSFKPKDHLELGTALGIIDTETAAKVAGSRFSYLKGDLVLLQFALIQFCLKALTDKDILERYRQGSWARRTGDSLYSRIAADAGEARCSE